MLDLLDPGALTAAWDLDSFLTNAAKQVGVWGGSLIILMGTAAVVWGAVLLIKKLMAGQQDQTKWATIILLIIIGGALMVGGFDLVKRVGEGGQQTIDDLGGSILLGLNL